MKDFTSDSPTTESRIGMVHNPTLGLATVTASRIPSAEADSEVYCSSPKVSRREDLRAIS